jgi:predicted TIM-barrel fold metal-dependent hydrolase
MHVNLECCSLKDAEKMVIAKTDKGEPLLSHVWLLSFNAPQYAGDDIVLEASKEFPDFYIPFGFLDFRLPPSHIDDLKARGFIGLKTIWPPVPYGDESLFPYYELAEKNKMPIVFHTSTSVYNQPETYADKIEKNAWGGRFMHVGELDIVAKLFPDLILVAAHMGVPNYDDAIILIKGHKNVYGDISSACLIREMDITDKVVRNFQLEDKLLFGVDTQYHVPYMSRKYINFWELYLSQNVRPEVQEKIMGLNALKILNSIKD